MRALSIRQPFAELILRGIKTVEYRSKPTSIIGERFHIYASKTKLAADSWKLPAKTWSDDLQLATPPAWMIELAEQIRLIDPDQPLPTGVIVGSAVIEKVDQVANGDVGPSALATGNYQLTTLYRWHLTDIRRATNLRKPKGQPQPVWFNPF